MFNRIAGFGVICCVLGGWALVSVGQSTPATGPAIIAPHKTPQLTELNLRIAELVGPAAELEKMTSEELAAQLNKAGQAAGMPVQFIGQLDLAAPTRLIISQRYPASRGDGKGLGYVEAGSELDISGAWKDREAEVRLKGNLRGIGMPGKVSQSRPAELSWWPLESTVQVSEGKTAAFKLQDHPTIDEQEPTRGRLLAGTLTLKRLASEAAAA